MSVLRCLLIFALVFLFISTASVFAAKSSWSTTSYYITGINKFWFAYAYAEATDPNDSGWFHVWAHCGTGGRDYTGGDYQGIMDVSMLFHWRLPVLVVINPVPIGHRIS